MQHDTDPNAASHVYYDGACPICRREIAAYAKVPGLERTSFLDVSQPSALPEGVSQEQALARLHIKRHNGEVVSGARAFIAIWRGVPRLRWIARAIDRWPFVPIAELAYRGFLKIRPLWRKPA